MCPDTAAGWGLAERLAASQGSGSWLLLLPACELVLWMMKGLSLSLFTWAITYVWNILPLLPFTWPTPIHLLCLRLDVTPWETSLAPPVILAQGILCFFCSALITSYYPFICVCVSAFYHPDPLSGLEAPWRLGAFLFYSSYLQPWPQAWDTVCIPRIFVERENGRKNEWKKEWLPLGTP